MLRSAEHGVGSSVTGSPPPPLEEEEDADELLVVGDEADEEEELPPDDGPGADVATGAGEGAGPNKSPSSGRPPQPPRTRATSKSEGERPSELRWCISPKIARPQTFSTFL